MKRSNTMNNKRILLAQTGLALICTLAFSLAGFEKAAAQSTPPVSLMSPNSAPSTAPVSIDAPIPGAPTAAPGPVAVAPHAPAVTTQTTTTQNPVTQTTTTQTTTQAAPANISAAPANISAGPANVPASIAPTSTVSTSTTVTPGAEQTLPVASNTEAGTQPSAAELAVVKSGAQNGVMPVMPAKHGAGQDNGPNGPRVTDILATPATIRPLPHDYLVVKKEHNANDIDARLTSARSALAQGNYQAALELFDDLYRKNPRDMRFAMGRAVALQKLGQTDEAMEAYQAALRTDPRNIEALTNVLGMLKGKDAPTALKKLQQLRDLYPANADVTAQLGMVYGEAGDYANAVKYLDMADALKPGSPIVLYNKAVAFDHMGKTAEAADLYRKILILATDGDLDQSFPLEQVRERLAVLR